MVRIIVQRLVAALGGRSTTPSDPLVVPARTPRSVEEHRVAGILAGLPVSTRGALVAALADDLRLADRDPFRGGPEIGHWRLALYERAADELVSELLGDFLDERPSAAREPTRAR